MTLPISSSWTSRPVASTVDGTGVSSLRPRGRERGQTIFLSSHILSEVEALCDRIGILREACSSRWGRCRRCATLGFTVEATSTSVPDLSRVPGVSVEVVVIWFVARCEDG